MTVMHLPVVPASAHYTHAFVRKSLPRGSRRILEVGCGDGALASLLANDGCRVLAIDNDDLAIEQALARGVDARVMEWPADLHRKFDAVLLSRGLNHAPDLNGAVLAAVDSLKDEGWIIVEDFRAEGGSPRSSVWYRGICELMHALGAIDDAARLLASESSPGDQALHSSMAIGAALANLLSVEQEGAAYYFRYLEPLLASRFATEALIKAECELIDAGAIDAFGQRFVGCKRANRRPRSCWPRTKS